MLPDVEEYYCETCKEWHIKTPNWDSQGDMEVLYEDGQYWIDRAAYERHKEEQRGKK